MGFEGFPLIIGWELTLLCNLCCRHCGSSAGRPRERELTTDEAVQICDRLPALLVHEVDFTGGEPLLRPDWPVIAERLQRLGINTKVITNGLCLATDTVSRLKDLGFAAIGVSLDGLEATHDHSRCRPGLFKDAVAGIERARAKELHVTVITTVNARNVAELPALRSLLSSLGVTHWQIQPMFPLGRAAASDLRLDEERYLAMGAFVHQCMAAPVEGDPEVLPGDSFGYYTEVDRREPAWRGCSAGIVTCGITSDGKVKGCLSMPDTLIEGDLRERDLWDIWFAPNAFAYNRSFRPEDLGPNCRQCARATECLGGCTAMSVGTTGHPHDDPYCFCGIRQRRPSGGIATDGSLRRDGVRSGPQTVPRPASLEPRTLLAGPLKRGQQTS